MNDKDVNEMTLEELLLRSYANALARSNVSTNEGLARLQETKTFLDNNGVAV